MEDIAVALAGSDGVDRYDFVNLAFVQRVQLQVGVRGVVIGIAVLLQVGEAVGIINAHVMPVDDKVAAVFHVALIIRKGHAALVIGTVQVVV